MGIEIDYENGSSPNLTGLQAFINAYRSQLPYDATGANPAARLTNRPGCRRPLSDWNQPEGEQQLAADLSTGVGLCQCHGEFTKDQHYDLGRAVAAAYRRALWKGASGCSGKAGR